MSMNTSPNRKNYRKFSLKSKRHKTGQPQQFENEQCIELLKGTQNGFNSPSKCNFINLGEEDQMQLEGYVFHPFKYMITLCGIFLTGGILRLIFHWYPHLYLKSTYRKVDIHDAQKILVIETYQDKHTSYYVKTLQNLTPRKVMEMEKAAATKTQTDQRNGSIDNSKGLENVDTTEIPLNLSVHFNGGIFKDVDSLRMFTCKKVTYIWDKDEDTFVKLRGLDSGVTSDILHNARGLTSHEQFTRRLVYGLNRITIPEKSVMTLLFLEVLNPFYIFQICSFALWFADEYYAYATAILTMSIFGIVMSIIQTKRNQRNLKSTVHSSDIVQVRRPKLKSSTDDTIYTDTISTDNLVPGDILEIPQHGCIMQCDAVLLTGNCILVESMLTGESVPVTKTPMPFSSHVAYDAKEHARHTLFCGTQVIQTRYVGDERVMAIVIRTGFSTAKGGLVRSILYPPPVDFRFEKDSYRFIILLGAIASIGFFYTIITKTMKGVSASELIVEALDLITIVVPPALPAAMTVGRMYAQRRLQKMNIFCISPRTINVSGSIDCVCFDKTGTLTEDGLDMLYVVPVVRKYFQIPIREISKMVYNKFMFGMVTCHSITIIDGELRGDPLDLKMFESTNWKLDEPDVSDNSKYDMIFPTVVKPPAHRKHDFPTNNEIGVFQKLSNPPNLNEIVDTPALEIGVLREFPFSSSLQRMSVIIRRLGATNFEYYCKGSPEMILTLVKLDSVPEDFHTQLKTYTEQGYRVIAIAHKDLQGMTYAKMQRATRENLEVDLEFLGLIILENRLKPETTPVIEMLNDAQIRSIMVTGDNLLTALSVAKECKMITSDQSVVTVSDMTPDDPSRSPQLSFLLTSGPKVFEALANRLGDCSPDDGGDYSILSTEADSSSVVSLATIESCTINTEVTTDSIHVEIPADGEFTSENYRFVMTGKTWAVVRRFYPQLLPKLITRGVVFARMSPDQKQSLVQELQALDYYVAMVGDGANDVGALRSSHCGISLSDTEASVASPFTSKTANITALTSVVSQGRAALVTSFSIFKYMAAYSLTQFLSVMLLYSIESNLTDYEFLYIDLFVITVFAYFFGKTEASNKLVPERPLNSLIGLSPVMSLVTQMLLVGTFQGASFWHLKEQTWYEPFNATTKDVSVGCVENFTIFTVSSFQYIILAIVFSKGKPHRKPMRTNIGFIVSAIVLTIFSLYLALIPAHFFTKHFELVLPNTTDAFVLSDLFEAAGIAGKLTDGTATSDLNTTEGTDVYFGGDLARTGLNFTGNDSLGFTELPMKLLLNESVEVVENFSEIARNASVAWYSFEPPTQFQFILLIYALANFILALFMEGFVVDYVVSNKLRVLVHSFTKSKKKFIKIEQDLQSDLNWPPLSDNFALQQKSSQDDVMGGDFDMHIQKTTSFSDENRLLDCFVEENNRKTHAGNGENVKAELSRLSQTPDRQRPTRIPIVARFNLSKSMVELSYSNDS